MTRLIERILAFLPRSQSDSERDAAYLGGAADFCDLERRMQELQERSRAA